ncbi:Asp/Glu racemase [Sulfitobacter noctilucicola]|uniref:Maleate isomerase n=1 Tax=Sulfitobacter noctilucicola TaxID=1342301 RepID=A0A7W6M6F8_9RHOB|nr:aspartate/glutamate racemase family protein [Sulfitobacter noctilucicola]KIN62157.1 Asp/Glu racemase [Sulfitobacter noctilucicola]MBB4173325.1 maleate isomerase [Sulfitobacter noctilucicola]
MSLPYTLNADHPTQIGMVVLQSDETLERDLRRLLPLEAEVLVSRVPSAEVLTQASITEMEGNLTQAARLLPRSADCAAVGYGCTSGTAQIGAARVGKLISDGVRTKHVTEPVSALTAACRALGITRLALISPYVAAISDQLRHVLGAAGIRVTAFASFDEPKEESVVRISAQSLRRAAIEIGTTADCEAVFLSCTNLRTLDVIDAIEDEIGKPVLSSNQVLGWHLMQLAALMPPQNLPGRLWQSGR